MDAATAEFEATMAFTTPDIAAGRIRPLFVLRHPKTGMWYLLPSVKVPTSAAEAMITLGEIATKDEALRQLAGMHAGQAARRSSPADPWRAVKLSQPLPVATARNLEGSKVVQLGAGHDPAVQRLERMRARFAGLATFWMTIPGIAIVLGGILAFIGLDLGKHQTLGFPTSQVIAAGLVVVGAWFVAFGLAAGAAVRPRWITVGSVIPFLLGGLAGAWGLGWLGIAVPDAGPVWFGVPVWWAMTQPLAILLLVIALLCWIAAVGATVCDRRLCRVDTGPSASSKAA
ncbi:MAG TPA: hypothetical protein VHX44_13010 [Planctomycetota bacterium]|jgi:hypothetical protein|nr:hypothetical protein [Planctomycetota bacterium]